MLAYATGERDGTEEDQPKKEPTDDWYCHLEEEICMKDANMDALTGKTNALMAKFGQHLG